MSRIGQIVYILSRAVNLTDKRKRKLRADLRGVINQPPIMLPVTSFRELLS